MIKVVCDEYQKEYNMTDDLNWRSDACTNCWKPSQIRSNELKRKSYINLWCIIIPTSFLGFLWFYNISSYIIFLVYWTFLSVGIFIFLSSIYWLYIAFKKGGTITLMKTFGKIIWIGLLCSPVLFILLLVLAFGSDSSGYSQNFWIKDRWQCNLVKTSVYSDKAPWYKQTCKANDILDKVTLDGFMFHEYVWVILWKKDDKEYWRWDLQSLSREEQDLFSKMIIPKTLGFIPHRTATMDELYLLFPTLEKVDVDKDANNTIYQDIQYESYAKKWLEYSQCSGLDSPQDGQDLAIKKMLTISAMYSSYIQIEGINTFITWIRTLNQLGYENIANEIVNETIQHKIHIAQLNKISEEYRSTFQCSTGVTTDKEELKDITTLSQSSQ